MKKLFLLLVVIVGISAGVPWLVGFKVEEQYQAILAHLTKSGFQLGDNHYSRGWFGASAESRFVMQLPATESPEKPSPTLAFTLKSDVTHGPWTKTAFLGLAEIDSKILVAGEDVFPEEYPARIHTLVSLNGSGDTAIDLPEIATEPVDEKPAIRFSGAQGHIHFDAQFKNIDLDFNLPSLDISSKSNDEVASISRIQLNLKSRENDSGLILGDGRFSIDGIKVKPPVGDGFALDKLSIVYDTGEANENVSADVTYRFQGLQVADDQYGPAELQLAFEQLPGSVLLSMQQAMEQMSQQPMQPAQQQMAVMTLLFSNGPALLKNDPRFAIRKLHVVTPEGVLDGDMSLQPVGLEWKEISNPAAVLDKLLADARITIPRVYVKKLLTLQMQRQLVSQYQARQKADEDVTIPGQSTLEQLSAGMAEGQLENLIQQGLLKQNADAYSAEMALEAGLLTINGKSMPLNIKR